MNILDTIKAQKISEVALLKKQFSYSFLEEQPLFNSGTHSMKKAIEK